MQVKLLDVVMAQGIFQRERLHGGSSCAVLIESDGCWGSSESIRRVLVGLLDAECSSRESPSDVTLTPELFVAEGAFRRLYRHPENPAWCVKLTGAKAAQRDESVLEARECQRLACVGCDFQHLPRFHKWTSTNLGEGSVWDLIANHDGSIAPSLQAVLQNRSIPPETIRRELDRFQNWCLRFGVITHDLHPKNFVCRQDGRGEIRILLVDGWGNREFIPVSTWSSALRQQKIVRRWQRFIAKYERLERNLPAALSGKGRIPNWGFRRKAA